jgi:hypothetical protein
MLYVGTFWKNSAKLCVVEQTLGLISSCKFKEIRLIWPRSNIRTRLLFILLTIRCPVYGQFGELSRKVVNVLTASVLWLPSATTQRCAVWFVMFITKSDSAAAAAAAAAAIGLVIGFRVPISPYYHELNNAIMPIISYFSIPHRPSARHRPHVCLIENCP